MKILPAADKDDKTPSLDIGSDIKYLLCVQPRCDSVRLEVATSFPFQSCLVATERFKLVVNDGNEHGILLSVNVKPRDTVMIRFQPDGETHTVKAVPEPLDQPGAADAIAQHRFVFSDALGRKYLWLADMKDLKAQRDASELAAQLHRVGIDELEWLRRVSKGDIKSPKGKPQ